MHLLRLPFFSVFFSFFIFFVLMHLFCAKASFMSCLIADSQASIERSQGHQDVEAGSESTQLIVSGYGTSIYAFRRDRKFSLLSRLYLYDRPRSVPLCPISASTVIGPG